MSVLTTIQANIDVLKNSGNANLVVISDWITTIAQNYDAGTFSPHPDGNLTATNEAIANAVIEKLLIDNEAEIDAAGPTVIAAITDIETTIKSLS
jgi:hypothetical protein